jgi:hypothetical protein
MSRLVFRRKPARFAAARLAGSIMPGKGASVGPLALESDHTTELPGALRVSAAATWHSSMAQRRPISTRW